MEERRTDYPRILEKLEDIRTEMTIEGYGTDAGALFKNSSDIQTILATTNPSYKPLSIPEGYTVSFNEDGSAVVTKV